MGATLRGMRVGKKSEGWSREQCVLFPTHSYQGGQLLGYNARPTETINTKISGKVKLVLNLPALLLAPLFSRSLTLVPRSFLLNRTETLTTQATSGLASSHNSSQPGSVWGWGLPVGIYYDELSLIASYIAVEPPSPRCFSDKSNWCLAVCI